MLKVEIRYFLKENTMIHLEQVVLENEDQPHADFFSEKNNKFA